MKLSAVPNPLFNGRHVAWAVCFPKTKYNAKSVWVFETLSDARLCAAEFGDLKPTIITTTAHKMVVNPQ